MKPAAIGTKTKKGAITIDTTNRDLGKGEMIKLGYIRYVSS